MAGQAYRELLALAEDESFGDDEWLAATARLTYFQSCVVDAVLSEEMPTQTQIAQDFRCSQSHVGNALYRAVLQLKLRLGR